MIDCKLKTKQLLTVRQQAVQTTVTLRKAIRWLNLIQCPLRVLTATDIASGKSSLKQQPSRFLPLRPTGGWENRLKGIVESRVLSGGVTCRQKCPDYSSPDYFQLSGTCLWLMKERTVRQSLRPWAGACVFHMDVVHGWQFGNLCGFAAVVVDAA